MKIALDIMSGDKAPNCNINGAIRFVKNPKSKNTHVVLYGTEKILNNNIKVINKHSDRISYKITKEIIDMDDKPLFAFKHKRNSSLIRIIDDLNEKHVSGAISCGNTAALLTSSLLILGKIKGIRRPALAPYIPIKGSGFILCDAGANTTVKPEHLYQFAVMSSAYLEHQGFSKKPRVALLNIGLEENKGNEVLKKTFSILSAICDAFSSA